MFVIKTFNSCGGSYATVERLSSRDFASCCAIYWIVGGWNSEALRFCEGVGVILVGSPGDVNATWFSMKHEWLHKHTKCPICGLRESKAYRCQPTASRENYSMV
jgi:hypothetical protein